VAESEETLDDVIERRSVDVEKRSADIDEWIATKMATKKDLYWAATVVIVITSLLFIVIKLLSRRMLT